jgi:hypothetical protein
MKLIFFYFLLFKLTISDHQQLIDLMTTEIETLKVKRPSLQFKYIISINSSGEFKFEQFGINEIDSKLKLYGFDEGTKKKFKGIIFAKSVTFQSFSLIIQPYFGLIEEIVGVARNNKGIVEIGFMKTRSYGTAIPQYSMLTTRVCRKDRLVFDKCWEERHTIGRGYTAEEMNIILQSLRAASYRYLKSKLQNIVRLKPTLTFLELDEQHESPASPVQQLIFLDERYNSSPGKIGAFAAGSDSGCDDFAKDIGDIKDKIEVDYFRSIPEKQVRALFEGLFLKEEFVGVKDEYTTVLKKFINKLLEEKIEKDDDIYDYYTSVFRFAFQKDGNKFIFYELILFHNNIADNVDLQVKHIILDTFLKKDFFIFKTDNDIDYISTTDEDNYFILYLESQFKYITSNPSNNKGPLLFLGDEKTSSSGGSEHVEEIDDFDDEEDFDEITKAVAKFVENTNIFYTRKRSTTVDKIVNRGFDKYDSLTKIQVLRNFKEAGLTRLKTVLSNRFGISKSRIEEFKNTFEIIQFVEKNIWTNFDIIFTNNTGKNKYVSVMVHRNENDTYDFMIVEVDDTFQLDPDIFIIEKTENIAGKLYETKDYMIKKVPKNLEQNDLDMTFTFFKLLSFKQIAGHLGIDVNLK